jgi:predicted nucleotidyltransferase
VNARPLLDRVAVSLETAKLEAILIGNAAAALQGAPVTTLDFDSFFRKTPTNLRKLKVFARELGATVMRPYHPASDMFRVVNDDIGLQVDFLVLIHGVRSFEALRKRAVRVPMGGASLLVAPLEDILKSKRAANRSKDRAVKRRSMKKRKPTRVERLDALRRESGVALREQIRRLLALPMEERTHFLRVRLPGGGSAL